MNKKFSTLVAVLLAAGAWTTLGAAVTVTEADAVKAGTYLIGNDGDNLSDEKYDVLLDPATGKGSAEEVAVAENTATWNLVAGDGGAFKLQGAESMFFTASNPESEDAGGLALDFEAAASENRVEVQFTIDKGKLKLANAASFANNTDIKDQTLYLKFTKEGAATLDATGTELVFSNWGADVPAEKVEIPGLGEAEVNADGVTVENGSFKDKSAVKVPMYIKLGNQYLIATADGAELSDDAPSADQALNASWYWDNAKLVSVAAERADKDEKYLKVAAKPVKSADAFTYTLVDATEAAKAGNKLSLNTNDLQVGGTTIASMVAQLNGLGQALPETKTVTISGSSVLVDGKDLSVFESMPSSSEYVLVAFSDGAATPTINYLKAGASNGATVEAFTDGTDFGKYLWKVSKSSAGKDVDAYTFTNLATEETWMPNGSLSQFIATKTDNVNGLTFTYNNVAVITDGTTAASGTQASVAFYQSPIAAKTKAELDKILNPGFGVTIALKKDDKTAIKGIEVFGKTLYPLTVSGKTIIVDKLNGTKTAAADDANYLVLDKAGWDGTKLENTKGEFIWVSKDDYNDTDKNKNWLSNFQVRYRAGMPSTYEMETLAVMNADGTLFGNAYVMSVEKTNYLVTKKSLDKGEVWPYISLNLPNIVNVKDLLGKYWNISFAETNVSDNEEYKLNGVLAVAYDADANYIPAGATKITGVDVAEYVKGSTVLKSSPESQWAVVSANLDDNSFVLQNRENPNVRIKNVTLRKTGDIYTIVAATAVYGTAANAPTVSAAPVLDGDQVYLESVKDHTKFDGFRTATVNELRNQVFHIGQYHNGTGNSTGLWAENHQSNASHQLGVVAGEDKEAQAVKWRLRLDNKFKSGEEIAEVDTIFVVTEFATLNAKGDGFVGSDKATKDTLAILPYQFQNKANLEYVIFNNKQNQNYFACDEHANVETSAVRFALKAKPNDTYNIVVLGGTGASKTTTLGDKKVYVGNSDQWGSIKKYNTYAADNNSLMQVIQIDKPEYRKVVKEWGDTIRIYREEYPTEVLFEKRDDKSVVDKDTLSFLNVNNSITGANPALFVDTAYVNRVDKEGIANTCYQYLLAVNVDKENSFFCPYNPEHNTAEWRKEHNGPCADALENRAVKGRFLINLVDTAFAYKQDHLHNNPYVNNVEAYEHLAKLSFVEGIHANDTLYITRKGGEVVKLAMDTTAFNVAKFAFRYVDNEAGSFKIQTQFKDYTKTTKKEFEKSANDNGYLRWVNGTIVVTDSYLNGETFNMEEGFAGDPTANENAPEVSSISVVAGNGSVTIKGAAGKTVSIANVLGQTIANTVLSSDEATIAAPAGVVVVAVEGEAAVKAIVK